MIHKNEYCKYLMFLVVYQDEIWASFQVGLTVQVRKSHQISNSSFLRDTRTNISTDKNSKNGPIIIFQWVSLPKNLLTSIPSLDFTFKIYKTSYQNLEYVYQLDL